MPRLNKNWLLLLLVLTVTLRRFRLQTQNLSNVLPQRFSTFSSVAARPLSYTLVLVRCREEAPWINTQIPSDWKLIIFEKCGQTLSSRFSVPHSNIYSEECSPYLRYLEQFAHPNAILSDVTVFMHADGLVPMKSHLGNDPFVHLPIGTHHTPFQTFQDVVNATKTIFEQQQQQQQQPPTGYINLGVKYMKEQFGKDPYHGDAMHVLWPLLFDNPPRSPPPPQVGFKPAAHFAVAANRIRSHRPETYRRLRDAILDVSGPTGLNKTNVRKYCCAMERMWHILLGEAPMLPTQAVATDRLQWTRPYTMERLEDPAAAKASRYYGQLMRSNLKGMLRKHEIEWNRVDSRPLTYTLVIVRCQENLWWLENAMLKRWNIIVYEKCGGEKGTRFSVPQKGPFLEVCSPYLTYLQTYAKRGSNLTDITVFMKADGFTETRPHRGPDEETVGLHHTPFASVEELVMATYILMQFHDEENNNDNDNDNKRGFVHLGTDYLEERFGIKSRFWEPLKVLWPLIHDRNMSVPLPKEVRYKPASHFMVTADRIRAHTPEIYDLIRRAILMEGHNLRPAAKYNNILDRCLAMERMWHILFGEPDILPTRAIATDLLNITKPYSRERLAPPGKVTIEDDARTVTSSTYAGAEAGGEAVVNYASRADYHERVNGTRKGVHLPYDYTLVVLRCKQDVAWIDQHVPKDWKVIVYEFCDQIGTNFSVVPKNNIGSYCTAYFQYFEEFSKMEQPTKVTVFMQGDGVKLRRSGRRHTPFSHFGEVDYATDILMRDGRGFVGFGTEYKKDRFGVNPNFGEAENHIWRLMHSSKPSVPDAASEVGYQPGGHFAVSADRILANPSSTYQSIRDSIMAAAGPTGALKANARKYCQVMDRMWHILLGESAVLEKNSIATELLKSQ